MSNRRNRKPTPAREPFPALIWRDWKTYADAIGPAGFGLVVGVYYGPLAGFLAGVIGLVILVAMITLLPAVIGVRVIHSGRFGLSCAVTMALLAGVFAIGRQATSVVSKSARIAQLEDQLARIQKPRELSKEAIEKLKSALRDVTPPYQVELYGAIWESTTLLGQLEDVLKGLGWKVYNDGLGHTQAFSGVSVNATATDCETAKTITRILSEDGLQTSKPDCGSEEKIRESQRIYIAIGLPDPTYQWPSGAQLK